jgi:hypothetical protein
MSRILIFIKYSMLSISAIPKRLVKAFQVADRIVFLLEGEGLCSLRGLECGGVARLTEVGGIEVGELVG